MACLIYYFYILQTLKNQKLYLGQTSDLKQRLESHNSEENNPTKPNGVWELSKKDIALFEEILATLKFKD